MVTHRQENIRKKRFGSGTETCSTAVQSTPGSLPRSTSDTSSKDSYARDKKGWKTNRDQGVVDPSNETNQPTKTPSD